jgi:uncharacterized alpha-E superfamily protein
MLVRNAESLSWIGRYVDRADDTARILDVAVHQLFGDSTVDPDRSSRLLLRVFGIDPPEGPLGAWLLTDALAFSRSRGGSIVDSVSCDRENDRGAREVASTEMREGLNATYNGLAERERAARRLGPREFFGYVETNVESHAWVQARSGSWWSYDPTSGVQVNERNTSPVGCDRARLRPRFSTERNLLGRGVDTP